MYTANDLIQDIGFDPEGVEFRALDVPNPYNGETWPKGALAMTPGHVNGLVMDDEGASGVYLVPNKSSRKTLDKGSKWASLRQKDKTSKASKDADITHFNVLIVDCDPIRIVDGEIRDATGLDGVNASDAEVAATRSVAEKVMEELKALSPGHQPGLIMTGNGHTAFALVSVPVTKEGLAQRAQILLSLANKFDNEHVSIDTSVWNPARMLPVPGTMKRKAPETEGRPHRRVEYLVRCSGLADQALLHEKLLISSPLTAEQTERLTRRAAMRDRFNGNKNEITGPYAQVKEGVPMDKLCESLGVREPRTDGVFNPCCPTCGKFSKNGGRTGFGIHNNRLWCWSAKCPDSCRHVSTIDLVISQNKYNIGLPPGLTEDQANKIAAKKALEWLQNFAKSNNIALPPIQRTAKTSDGRLEIILSNEEYKHVGVAVKELGKREVYERGGILVNVATRLEQKDEEDDSVGVPRARAMSMPAVRNELSAVVSCLTVKKSKEGETELVPTHIPKWLEQGVFFSSDFTGIRPLEAVSVAPYIRKDGSVVSKAGYDEATKRLYMPNCDFLDVPASPTQDDAIKAKEELLQVVEEFPFKSEMHRAGYLAALLTPFARAALGTAVAPCFSIDASRNDLGKTKLATAIRLLVEGVSNTAKYPEKEDERAKRWLAYAMEAAQFILLDNVTKGVAVGGATLEAWLTNGKVEDRILGTSQSFSGNMPAMLVVTGNNLQHTQDMNRRTIHIRLEANYENPADVKHKFVFDKDFVLANRARLVRAILTILRAFMLAGKPVACSMNSFEKWAALVGGAVMWVGLPDPTLTTRELIASGDNESSELGQLMVRWEEAQGSKAKGLRTIDAINIANDEGGKNLKDALVSFYSRAFDSPARLGTLLSSSVGQVIDGKKLIKCMDKKSGAHYKVVSATGDALPSQSEPKGATVDKLIDEQMDAIKAPKANGKAAPGIIRAPGVG